VATMSRTGASIVKEKKSAALKEAQMKGSSTVDRSYMARKGSLEILSA
jgi:hypothetical protein